MPKRLLAGVAALVVAGAVAVPALAASPNAAQPVPFRRNAFGSCITGALGGSPSTSFAVIKQNPNGTISAVLNLTGALPSATYTVEIAQTPSGAGCNVPIGTLQTDGLGDGDGRFTVSTVPGATDANVFIFSGDDSFQSLDYVFGSR